MLLAGWLAQQILFLPALLSTYQKAVFARNHTSLMAPSTGLSNTNGIPPGINTAMCRIIVESLFPEAQRLLNAYSKEGWTKQVPAEMKNMVKELSQTESDPKVRRAWPCARVETFCRQFGMYENLLDQVHKHTAHKKRVAQTLDALRDLRKHIRDTQKSRCYLKKGERAMSQTIVNLDRAEEVGGFTSVLLCERLRPLSKKCIRYHGDSRNISVDISQTFNVKCQGHRRGKKTGTKKTTVIKTQLKRHR